MNVADTQVSKVVTALKPNSPQTVVKLKFRFVAAIGHGSFGYVSKIKLQDSEEELAVKTIRNCKESVTELKIMGGLKHINIIELKYYFKTQQKCSSMSSLSLVMECMPRNLEDAAFYCSQNYLLPDVYIKVFVYQLMRGLSYIHRRGIAHRDIKPANILVDINTGMLKICDFGSAQYIDLIGNCSCYVCTRMYRAPELLLECHSHSEKIDIWSAGCIFAELLNGTAIFAGDTSYEHLEQIINTLGSPTDEEMTAMDVEPQEIPLKQRKSWKSVLRREITTHESSLLLNLLNYNPSLRPDGLVICGHPYFDSLRDPKTTLDGCKPLPPLFLFTQEEIIAQENLNIDLKPKLIPNE